MNAYLVLTSVALSALALYAYKKKPKRQVALAKASKNK